MTSVPPNGHAWVVANALCAPRFVLRRLAQLFAISALFSPDPISAQPATDSVRFGLALDSARVRGALERVEQRRIPHTVRVTQGAYHAGRMFHHFPSALRPLRDFIFDHTPLLQKIVGDEMPDHILSQLSQIEDSAPYIPVHKRAS